MITASNAIMFLLLSVVFYRFFYIPKIVLYFLFLLSVILKFSGIPNSTPVTNNVASLPVMKTLLVPKPSDNIRFIIIHIILTLNLTLVSYQLLISVNSSLSALWGFHQGIGGARVAKGTIERLLMTHLCIHEWPHRLLWAIWIWVNEFHLLNIIS